MKIARSTFWLVWIAFLAAVLFFFLRERGLSEVKPSQAPADAMQATHASFETERSAMDCPTPFDVERNPQQPLQARTQTMPEPFQLAHGVATPIAAFAVEGRVLGRKNYDSDHEARFAPTDLALGWSRMRDPAVISRLHITQSSRWYHYSWSGEPPLPVEEIVRSSANMHMVPANARIAEALSEVERDDLVRVDGFLVTVSDGKGWSWYSSTTREDAGAGACEVVYVCRVRVTSN